MPEATLQILYGEIRARQGERIKVMRRGKKEGGKISLLDRDK